MRESRRALVTGPALEPVSLAEAKDHCRVFINDDDAKIAGYLIAARSHVEQHTNRVLMTQTWDLSIDYDWPEREKRYREFYNDARYRYRIELPLPPLQSVNYVKYIDGAGALQTLAASQYKVVTDNQGAFLEEAFEVVWPEVRDEAGAVSVRFLCGYGSNPGDVPEPVRQAILLLTSHFYENPSASTLEQLIELPMGVQTLLFPFRVLC